MKFRIIEVKRKYQKPFFRPEYKSFLFWNKVSDSEWVGTIFCHYKFSNWENGCLESKSEAENCIRDFIKWLGQCEEYETVHLHT